MASSNQRSLSGLKVAILSTDGFEQVELLEPKKALEKAGAEVVIVSPKSGSIQGMNHDKKGDKIAVDLELSGAKASDFDALVLPGGVANPDALRIDEEAIAFVKAFVDADKPIAAICHGPWTLIEAEGVSGKEMTSWPSLKTDLRNAGAEWFDKKVVVSEQLVTSRKPDDLPDFNREMLKLFASGRTAEKSPQKSAAVPKKKKTQATPSARI
jgi:protease I